MQLPWLMPSKPLKMVINSHADEVVVLSPVKIPGATAGMLSDPGKGVA